MSFLELLSPQEQKSEAHKTAAAMKDKKERELGFSLTKLHVIEVQRGQLVLLSLMSEY